MPRPSGRSRWCFFRRRCCPAMPTRICSAARCRRAARRSSIWCCSAVAAITLPIGIAPGWRRAAMDGLALWLLVVCRIYRSAVRRALRERTPAAKLVRRERSHARGQPLRSLRGVQSRLVRSAVGLSRRHRAVADAADADMGLVGRLCAARGARCRRRPVAARAAPVAAQAAPQDGAPAERRDECGSRLPRFRPASSSRSRRICDRFRGRAVPVGAAAGALSADLCGGFPRTAVGRRMPRIELGAVRGGAARRHLICGAVFWVTDCAQSRGVRAADAVCHGELYARRPGPARLTEFYLGPRSAG